jgi:predicted transcriptional regulator
MFLNQIQDRILATLRYEALNAHAIAYELDEPPYRIRGELKRLKRERLVRDRIEREGYLWELTDRGVSFLFSGDQTELPL